MIGLNTAGLSRSLLPELPEGIGFAIPVNLAAGVLRQIIDHGRVIRGWLGAGFQNLTPQRAETLGVSGDSGIEVTRIIADSPAMRAGMRVGDVLTHFDRRPVYHVQDALNHIAGTPPGESLSLRGLRSGETFTLQAEVVERPTAVPQAGR
jgi:S1-C subfamily serine protease